MHIDKDLVAASATPLVLGHPDRRRVVRLRDPQARQRALRRAHAVDRRHALPAAAPAGAARVRWASWGTSDGGRRRKHYAITARAGRRSPSGASSGRSWPTPSSRSGMSRPTAAPSHRGGRDGCSTPCWKHRSTSGAVTSSGIARSRRPTSTRWRTTCASRSPTLTATGLTDDEAFLVAVKRMGNLDEVSREFAREHSDRLWKQLVLLPPRPRRRRHAVRELRWSWRSPSVRGGGQVGLPHWARRWPSDATSPARFPVPRRLLRVEAAAPPWRCRRAALPFAARWPSC